MKFSYNWISELVDGLDVSATELSNHITLKTAESEGVEEHGAALSFVRLARVEQVEPIEGSKNVKAVVDVGPLGGRRWSAGLRIAARDCDCVCAAGHDDRRPGDSCGED